MENGFLTDQYEVTMLQAARHAGMAERRCAFEVFTRHLPPGRRYGVVAGTARILDGLSDFRFSGDQLHWLVREAIVDMETADYLESYRFGGDIYGYAEGEMFFPNSPIMRVVGTFAEVVLLETYLLSVFNHDCAIASAASRMTWAAGNRPCLEMGSRRTHERSAVDAARAAAVAGFAGTSNLEAGYAYGLHTIGTAAHAFTLLFDREEDAFKAQLEALGEDTTLLVDTYDIANAIDQVVAMTDGKVRAVRIDSGDPMEVSRAVRAQLDKLGAHDTRITATSDLDEHKIYALRDAPVDSYGVGTQLVTGSGAPTAGFVYKMVAHEANGQWVPVAKRSADKAGVGGVKRAIRTFDADGKAQAEMLIAETSTLPIPEGRELQKLLVKNGEVLEPREPSKAVARAIMRHSESRNELRLNPEDPLDGPPAVETHVYGPGDAEGYAS